MPALLLSLLFLAGPAWAVDLATERAWAEAQRQGPLAPYLRWLEADGLPFPVLWRETHRRPAMGAVLILPERGTHPAWPQVTRPLWEGLAAHGWSTLALSLTDGPPWPEALALGRARIDAARAFLARQGQRNLALAGHGFGALLAADYAARQDPEAEEGLRALVLISLPTVPDGPLDGAALLSRLRLPVLDLWAEGDLEAVRRFAEARRRAARRAAPPEGFVPLAPSPRSRGLAVAYSGNPAYRQVRVPATDHRFSGRQDWLLRTVAAWLARVAPGMEVASP